MDAIDKLFSDLESNNVQRADDAKKRLCEQFSQSKESWLVAGMMDYFAHTSSARAIDILVKVQQPHDRHIFDRLDDWLSHATHRQHAITLFGHIVKRHPSWLHKVAGHPLLRQLLRQLKSDTNICSAMNALFCIIILLPIIPTAMPNYLADLFDILLQLAAWNCHQQPRLTEGQAIHLQIGLAAYFQRLYGMFPCNLVAYLRDHVQKTETAVFAHTVRPLLETVKMHPALLTSSREAERAQGRWKEMEPHDVVVECSRFALDSHRQSAAFVVQRIGGGGGGGGGGVEFDASGSSGFSSVGGGFGQQPGLGDCPYYKMMSGRQVVETPISQQLHRQLRSTPQQASSLCSPFYSPFSEPFNASASAMEPQRHDNMWSPLWSGAVMATPPPLMAAAASIASAVAAGVNTSGSSGGSSAPLTPTPSLGGVAAGAVITQKPAGTAAAAAANSANVAVPVDVAVASVASVIVEQQVPAAQHHHHTLCVSGSSPPEAAVEATPETTPMKPADALRQFPDKSPAVRAIWGAGVHMPPQVVAAAPTSPLRREAAFRFNPAEGASMGIKFDAASPVPVVGIASPKILSFVTERSMYAAQVLRQQQQHQQNVVTASAAASAASGAPGNNNTTFTAITATAAVEDVHSGGAATSTSTADSTPEDAEVTQITALAERPPLPPHARFKRSPNGNTPKTALRQQLQQRPSTDDDGERPDQPAADADGENGNNDNEDDDDCADDDESRRLHAKRSHFAAHKAAADRRTTTTTITTTIATQTIDQLPTTYEQMFLELLSGRADGGGRDRPATIRSLDPDADGTETADEATSTIITAGAALEPRIPEAAASAAAPVVRLSPYELLDQYIASNSSGDQRNNAAAGDQIHLLQLQLQFERYRREVHAERNRRLLGKSRVNVALEMENEKLREQRDRLAADADELTAALNRARVVRTAQETEHATVVQRWQREAVTERTAVAELRSALEAMRAGEAAERERRKAAVTELAACKAEMFDVRGELAQTAERAEWGRRCGEEMQRLQQEVLLMGEIQVRCRERLAEVGGWRAREAEAAMARQAYQEEVREWRAMAEMKAGQLETARARLGDLEGQLSRRDAMFTDQKRLLKTVKEEYQDRFRALEAKYTAQKAILLRMEEEMLDLYHRNQTTTAAAAGAPIPTGSGGGGGGSGSAGGASSAASACGSVGSGGGAAGGGGGGGSGSGGASAQQTPDVERHAVGSLDHASPLSMSLASSEGLAISLRSTATEIRNLHPLIATAAAAAAAAPSRSTTISQQPHASTTLATTTNNASASVASEALSSTTPAPAPSTAAPRQPISEEIPVPTASSSASSSLRPSSSRGSGLQHQLHKHQHL